MMEKRENREEMEKLLEQTLTEGPDLESGDEEKVRERARERISAPYEYRIQAERDPIAEETKIIRSMAKEPDRRYDDYARPQTPEEDVT